MFLSKIKFISKEIQNAIPYPHKLIHDHYVLTLKQDRFVVFTTSPLRHPKTSFISHETINGETKNQYMSSYVYKIEPNIMVLEPVENGEEYIKKNFVAISKAQKGIDLDDSIELSQYLSILGW